jgi:GNAT superfamily N-acetyltransferase
VNNARLHLRRIESRAELAPARTLAREFGDWASKQLKAQLGIAIPAEADHPTHVLDEILDSGGRLYVAEVDGEAAGIGGLKRLSPTEAEIKRMFVRPTTRGLGLGRTILCRLIDDAHQIGCETVYLESAPFMHSAHVLYQNAGFVPCEAYPGREFEGGAHDVSQFMRLDLRQKPSVAPRRGALHDVAVP